MSHSTRIRVHLEKVYYIPLEIVGAAGLGAAPHAAEADGLGGGIDPHPLELPVLAGGGPHPVAPFAMALSPPPRSPRPEGVPQPEPRL